MSEKIYTWLLRLYPSYFRQTYGEASLQLFRDRSRHERGFRGSLRLWLDLLADLASSVPREHQRLQAALVGAPALRYQDGTPSFHVLEERSPRPAALILGGLLSLAVAGASIPIGQIVNSRPFLTASAAHSPLHKRWPVSSRRTTDARGETDKMTIAPLAPANVNTLLRSSDVKPTDFKSKPILAQLAPGPPQPPRPQPQSQDAPRLMAQAVVPAVKLEAAERQRVIQAVIANLKQHYFDKQVAEATASALLAHEQAGDYNAVNDGQAFGNLLARHLAEASRDVHFTMEYTRNVFPDFSKPPPPEAQARYRTAMEQANCTFEKVEIRPNNVGYMKLNSFPDTAACQSKAESAMTALNRADALIFDLRDNRGGNANMVVFLASYLFDHPEYMFNPRDPITEQSWTRAPVAGSLVVDKPVYVLTSSRTYSAAEQFSYDLKMLKRATLVGETTGGAAHTGTLHNLDDHFAIGIPEHRPVNPFGDKDWAVTGVEPNVKVKAADALATAEKLAETKLRRR